MTVSVKDSPNCIRAWIEMPNIDISPKVEKNASYVLFQKIKECVSNHKLWENLLLSVNKEISNGDEPLETLTTSCVINMLLLNYFFVGGKQAKKIMDILGFSTIENIKFVDIDTKKAECLIFHHFLSGNEVINLNTKFQDPTYKHIAKESIRLQDPEEYLIPLKIFIEKVQKMYYENKKEELCIYDFNHNVINTLEAEIKENSPKVSAEKSFVYQIAITQPDFEKASKGSLEEIICQPTAFLHAFILEHYYCRERNTDLIRMHQAWKGVYTLEKFYEKANYNSQDRGCMNQGDVKIFCNNLRGMLSGDESPDYVNLRKCMAACFGVDAKIKLPGVFRKDLKIFTGRSIRYLTSQINPKDCLRNFEEVINKYGKV